MTTNVENFLVQEILKGEHPASVYEWMKKMVEMRPGGYFRQTKNPDYDTDESAPDSEIEYRYYYSTTFTHKKVEYKVNATMSISYCNNDRYYYKFLYINWRNVHFEGEEAIPYEKYSSHSINDWGLPSNYVDEDDDDWQSELSTVFKDYERGVFKDAVRVYGIRKRKEEREKKKQEETLKKLEQVKKELIKKHCVTSSKVDQLFEISMKAGDYKERQVVKLFEEYLPLIK